MKFEILLQNYNCSTESANPRETNNNELFKGLKSSLNSSFTNDEIKSLASFIEEKKWDKNLFLTGLNHIMILNSNSSIKPIVYKKNSVQLFGFKYKKHGNLEGFYESRLSFLGESKGFIQKKMLDCYNVIYTGEWEKAPNGKGSITYGIGDYGKGVFKDGVMIEGEIHFNETNEYRFFRSKKFIQKGNENYKGQLKASNYFGYELFHGWGSYSFKNGDLFEGQWQNHQPNGEGRLTLNTGQIFDGIWKDGVFQNDQTIFFNRNPKPYVGSQIHYRNICLINSCPEDYKWDQQNESFQIYKSNV